MRITAKEDYKGEGKKWQLEDTGPYKSWLVAMSNN